MKRYRLSLPSLVTRTFSQSCWAEDPAKRPSFAKVGDLLQGMLQEGIDQNWYVSTVHRCYITRAYRVVAFSPTVCIVFCLTKRLLCTWYVPSRHLERPSSSFCLFNTRLNSEFLARYPNLETASDHTCTITPRHNPNLPREMPFSYT